LLPAVMMPGVLEVLVVLIRPEPVDRAVGLARADHAPRRSSALLHSVLPVLDTHPPPEHRVPVVRHIAGSVDIVHVRSAVLVDKNAVVYRDAAAVQEIHDRFDADTDNGKVAGEATPAFGDDAFHMS